MFCKKCGAQIPDNAKFCPKCGAAGGAVNVAALGQQQPVNNVPQNNGQRSSFNGRIIAIIVLLLVVVGGAFAVFRDGSKGSESSTSNSGNVVVIKSETLVDDYIRDSASANTKYGNKTVQITGKVLYKNQFTNDVSFCVTLYAKSAGGKHYSVSIAMPVAKVNEVNKLKNGDFVTAEGHFEGIVPQENPLDISLQIKAEKLNGTKI